MANISLAKMRRISCNDYTKYREGFRCCDSCHDDDERMDHMVLLPDFSEVYQCCYYIRYMDELEARKKAKEAVIKRWNEQNQRHQKHV